MYFFLFSDLCRGGATLLASWSSSLDSTPPPTSPPLPLSLIHFRGEPMGVPPSDFALTTWREKREETETDGMTIYLEYHIAENFQGRKLLRISWFCGYTQNFSLQNLGRGILRRCKKRAICKSFLRENCIFTNSRKFSPSKVSRYTYVITIPLSSHLLPPTSSLPPPPSHLLPPMHTNKQHTHLSIHTVINALITAPEIPEGLPSLHLECTTNSN